MQRELQRTHLRKTGTLTKIPLLESGTTPGSLQVHMRPDLRTHVRIIFLILVCICPPVVTSLLAWQVEGPVDNAAEEGSAFRKVYEIVAANFAEPVDPDRAILDGAIRGMLATLDPFCSFLDADQFEKHSRFVQGKSQGFGSTLFIESGKILVLQTAPGSPSRRAGLGPGDEIVQINGQRCDRLSLESLVELLQRARTQPVRLGVIHAGEFVAHEHELNPAELPKPTVDTSFLLQPDIAYMHVASFGERTAQEVFDTIHQFRSVNLKGLLLDLRRNHGGALEAAVGVASLFLEPDVLVVTQRGRVTPEKGFYTVEGLADTDLPLVVLVDGETADAAEVLAAALQEHNRALIAGEPTMGKGVVQSVIGLSEGNGLTLTTAQYFTPKGRPVQRPLSGTALADPNLASITSKGQEWRFRTDNGRPTTALGGIAPDVVIPSPQPDPWAAALGTQRMFTSFASEYLTTHAKVDRSFEPDAQILALFRDYLLRNHIHVAEEDWLQNQDYLKLGIKTGLLTLVFGLSAGDEVRTRGDIQVQGAISLFEEISSILGPRMRDAGTLHSAPHEREPLEC